MEKVHVMYLDEQHDLVRKIGSALDEGKGLRILASAVDEEVDDAGIYDEVPGCVLLDTIEDDYETPRACF